MAVLLLALLVAGPAWPQGDPFRRAPAAPAPSAQVAPADSLRPPGDPLRPAGDPPRGASTPAPAAEGSGFSLPGPIQAAVAHIAAWQREFNRRLTHSIREAGHAGGFGAPALTIVLLAFLYGVFHAAGPGHGKVVTTTYFLARRARLLHGVLAGSIIAAVQAVTAIAAVLGLAWLLDVSGTRLIGQTLYLELASYALIVGIGLWMAVGALRGDAHDHDHGPRGYPAEAAGTGRASAQLISASVAAGLRPCTGAILVLLFALANGIIAVGIVATFAMAVGVALTISAMGIATILLRKGLALAAPAGSHHAALAHRVAGGAGAVAITVLGALLFLGTLSRLGSPL